MSTDTNLFGGKNPHGNYTPLSEDEQEVLERLALAGQYKVVIKDWGHVDKPRVRFGDARLELTWNMVFDRPEAPMPVYFFDLELRTHSGILLSAERLPVITGGQPLQVCAGIQVRLAWDIQIKKIDPQVVRAIKPGVVGLTSRLGNMKLTSYERDQLHKLRKGEAAVRVVSAVEAAAATKRAKSGR